VAQVQQGFGTPQLDCPTVSRNRPLGIRTDHLPPGVVRLAIVEKASKLEAGITVALLDRVP
jgi:hypothetical protein